MRVIEYKPEMRKESVIRRKYPQRNLNSYRVQQGWHNLLEMREIDDRRTWQVLLQSSYRSFIGVRRRTGTVVSVIPLIDVDLHDHPIVERVDQVNIVVLLSRVPARIVRILLGTVVPERGST